MSDESWLQPHLDAILKSRIQVLADWRRQLPTQAGRTKNFENWLLVELVHHLLETGFARDVRTNGHFSEEKVKAIDVEHLGGSKANAKHLSADLAVRLSSEKRVLSAEIKTGLAPKEVLNDLRIVRHYNKIGICDRAEFGWVVLLPETEEARRSSLKTFEKIYRRMKEENVDFVLLRTNVSDWLFSCVAAPVSCY